MCKGGLFFYYMKNITDNSPSSLWHSHATIGCPQSEHYSEPLLLQEILPANLQELNCCRSDVFIINLVIMIFNIPGGLKKKLLSWNELHCICCSIGTRKMLKEDRTIDWENLEWNQERKNVQNYNTVWIKTDLNDRMAQPKSNLYFVKIYIF